LGKRDIEDLGLLDNFEAFPIAQELDGDLFLITDRSSSDLDSGLLAT
jgi:hypothetical protein